MAAMAGGRGGMIPWAWHGRGGNSSQSRESRQKAAIFYQKKSKKLFFLLFFRLTLLVFLTRASDVMKKIYALF